MKIYTFLSSLLMLFYINLSAQYKITKDINYSIQVQATYNKMAVDKNGLSYVVTTRSPQNTLSRYNFDGKLDTTFGVGGKVNIQQDGGKDIFATDNYIYILSNYNVLSKFDINGQLIPSFGVNGSLDLTLDYQNIYFDDNTPNFYVVSKTQGITKITKYNSVGQPDQNFNELVFPYYVRMIICKDHDFLITNVDPTNNTKTELRKYSENGILDANFGVNGLNAVNLGIADISKFFTNSKNEIFILAGYGELFVHKLTPSGFVDVSFGKNGVFAGYDYNANIFVYSFDTANANILFDSNDNVIVMGMERFGADPKAIILRLNKNGNLDRTFHNNSFGFYNEDSLSSIAWSSSLSKFRLIDDNTFMFVRHYNFGGPWHGAYSPHKYVRKNTLGVLDANKQNATVYPNPTDSILNIKLSSADKSINWKLYSVEGKLVMEGSQVKLDMKNLPKGQYFLIMNDSNIKSQHVIIKK